jgi:hypothetical protein
MIETLALAAGAVFLVGLGLSVMIAELLRRRDTREAERRAVVQRKTADRRHRPVRGPQPIQLTPAAAAERAIQSRQAALASPRVCTPRAQR